MAFRRFPSFCTALISKCKNRCLLVPLFELSCLMNYDMFSDIRLSFLCGWVWVVAEFETSLEQGLHRLKGSTPRWVETMLHVFQLPASEPWRLVILQLTITRRDRGCHKPSSRANIIDTPRLTCRYLIALCQKVGGRVAGVHSEIRDNFLDSCI